MLDGIAEGAFPKTVRSFSDLHEHVDANDYLEDHNVPWGTDLSPQSDDPAGVRVVNAVTDRVSELLDARYRAHEMCPAEAHDRSVDPHTVETGEQNVDADGLLACNDCGVPTFYCDTTGWYHHLDPNAEPCFLAQE